MEITQITHENTESVILNNMDSVVPPGTEENFRSRRWSFTLNNYTEEEITHITHYNDHMWCVGVEVGENGTPHLQGYIEIPNGKTLKTMKKIIGNRAHLEPAIKHKEANLIYCRKNGNMLRDDFPCIKKYCGEDLPKKNELYDWQLIILDILKQKPEHRKIYWFYEEKGNAGKSMFGKYLCYHNKNIIMSTCTKSADILTMVDEQYDTYIFDFPRTLGPNYCPYTAFEQLKNGYVTEAKLKKKARKIMMNPPHVIVFSNYGPDWTKLSFDKWKVYNIFNKKWEESPYDSYVGV